MDTDDRHPPEMADTFAAVHSLALNTSTIDDFLGELAELAAEIVDPAASCGITAYRDGRATTVAYSDKRATEVDDKQYDTDEGPCLTTLQTGEVVLVPDMATEQRWPRYRELAVQHDVRSSLSIPLIVRNRVEGALNLYGYRPHAFDGDQQRHAEVFAAQASTALTLMTRHVQQAKVSQQLEQALRSRSTIDHAIGILMAQQKCTSDEAYELLRQHSRNNNRKLRDVAADLVERTTGKPPADPPPFRRPPVEPV